jgi:hypothetical protein
MPSKRPEFVPTPVLDGSQDMIPMCPECKGWPRFGHFDKCSLSKTRKPKQGSSDVNH